MSQKHLDITPDRSLIRKLGSAGYTTIEALSELVDNCIDARSGEKITVRLDMDYGGRTISISDDGTGMDAKGLERAMTLAKSAPASGRRLGKFGMGMKTSCSTLGSVFSIATSTAGSHDEYKIRYSDQEWESSGSLGWARFPCTVSAKKDADAHGTAIFIEKIKIPMYRAQIPALEKKFGERYAGYIKSGQLRLVLNKNVCKAIDPEIEPNSTQTFDISLSNAVIPIEISILKKRSIRGSYGIDLYYRNRLIMQYSSFGITKHPTIAKIIGKVHLDHVPVNFTKTNFLTESAEYEEAETAFKTDPRVRKVISEQRISTADRHAASSVLGYFAGKRKSPVRISTKSSSHFNAKKTLDALEPVSLRAAGREVQIEFTKGEQLYTVQDDGNVVQIQVGKNSQIFKTSKSPFYTISMIMAEVRSMPDFKKNTVKFLERRNALWEKFSREISPSAQGAKPRKSLPPGYGLHDSLSHLHSFVRKKYVNKFQFTGMSTLSPYAHYAITIPIYSLYTEKGGGRDLVDTVRQFEGFVPIFNPGKKELSMVVEAVQKRASIIVVREYHAVDLALEIAPPAKAWIDLYREAVTYGMAITEEDLKATLDHLISFSMASPDAVRSLANRYKIDLGKEYEEVIDQT